MGHQRVLIESGIIFNLLLGFFWTVILFFGAGFLANNVYGDPLLEPLIRVLSLGLAGQVILNVSASILVGYERMGLRSSLNVVFAVLKSVLAPLLVYLGYGPLGAVWGDVGPILITGLIGLLFVMVIYRNIADMKRSFSHFEGIKLLLRYGFPLFLSNLLMGTVPHIHTSLLGVWVGAELTGNYSATLRFSVLLSFITMPISTVLFPLFSKLGDDIEELKFVYQNAVKYTSLLAYPIIAIIFALAPQIVMILYSADYSYTAGYLRWYILTFLSIGIGSTCNMSLLNSQGKTQFSLRVNALKFFVTVPLAIYLIPRVGVIGLIVSIIIGTIIGPAYSLFLIRDNLGLNIDYLFSLKALTSLTFSAAGTWFVSSLYVLNPWVELVFGGMVAVLIYLFIILLLKSFDRRDIDYLYSFSRSLGRFSGIFKMFLDVFSRFV